MDDLSIHELVGISRSYPDFLIPPKKRFAGRHIFRRMQQIYQLFWLDFQPSGRVSCATFATDLLLPSLLWDYKITNIASDLSIDSHVSTAPRFFA
jgi:hypothetical protein